jgi:HD-like signal output (HDOD) protein
MTEELIDRIRSVPPLPKTFIKIDAICSDKNGTIVELSKVVEKDPMLVANLLKIVNSPLYGLRSEIKSVSQAVSLLGMKEINSLAATVSIKKLLKVDMEPYGIEPERFALISNMQGALIKAWFRKIDRNKAETLFMPALLQETGKIIIADEIVRNDEVFQFKSEIETTTNIPMVEKMYVDTTSAKVTAKIFEHWDFEEFIVNIIKYSDDYTKAPDEYREFSLCLKVVKIAIAINTPLSERNITIACNILEKEGLSSEQFLEAIDVIKKNYKENF